MNKFVYVRKADWPPLAWMAECTEGTSEILVHHGSRVETRPDWFCEAIWDGDFEAGDFDHTDLVFGSGGRVRSDSTIFVSSGSTVDRLQFLRLGTRTLVSNSLACLKSMSSGWPSARYPGFVEFFGSIVGGLDRYERIVPEGGPTLTYFQNLVWDGRGIKVADKPLPARDFSCFDAYAGFLQEALIRIGSNIKSSSRRFKLDMIGTVSSGYDSSTVAALARKAGLTEVLTFATAREGHEDSGYEIAERLGLKVTTLDRLAWKRSAAIAEVCFFAADSKAEDILFAGAEEHLRNRVLLTGYHGDKVWEKETTVALTPTIMRGDQSGLSLTEYRLLIGMIHLPVPFMGVRNIQEINKVSRSSEMRPWDVGRKYNRPICRRIVEEAGIPRHLFGQHKKAASNLFSTGETCFTRLTRIDYHRWRHSHAADTAQGVGDGNSRAPLLGRWLIPEIFCYAEMLARRFFSVCPKRVRKGVSWRLYDVRYRLYKRANYFIQWAFPWALDRLAAKYRSNT